MSQNPYESSTAHEGQASSKGDCAKKLVGCALMCGTTFLVARFFYIGRYSDDLDLGMQRAQYAAWLNAAIGSLTWQMLSDAPSKSPSIGFGAVLVGCLSGSVSYFAMAIEVAVMLLPRDMRFTELWDVRLLLLFTKWTLASAGIGFFSAFTFELVRSRRRKPIR